MQSDLPVSMSVASILQGFAQEIQGCAQRVRTIEAQVLLSGGGLIEQVGVQPMQDLDLLTQTLDDIADVLRRLGQSAEATSVLRVQEALSEMRLFDLQQRIAKGESKMAQKDVCALIF